MEEGIDPESLFDAKSSVLIFKRLLISGGIAPVRLLLLRTKSETWFNLPNDDGISPVKKLELKSTSFRRLSCPNSSCKSPSNPLPLKLPPEYGPKNLSKPGSE
ncbi:hypothetical protein ES332_A13G049700v1 [Gossypium tomentosum]|uniref:Uncharacterized protein n=1 Tax=Gossypium tomentosum TaxID=34277 RepID=A0A5D2MGW4_GOSTO|nr:hypothetical protein ES332_A13G049700v1 [Gossypium tomentosum]